MRRERGHTLKAVAAATGISSSFLSLVETDRSDITFGRLHRLLAFYGATFADLVPAEPPADPLVVRAAERRSLPSRTEGIELFLLTHDPGRALQPVLAEYRPGARLHEYRGGVGEAFIHVVDGTLEVELEGRDPIVLEAGDSFSYDTDRALRVANPGPDVARLLAVGTATAAASTRRA